MITCDWQILGVQCLLPRSSVAREVMSIEAEVLSGVCLIETSSYLCLRKLPVANCFLLCCSIPVSKIYCTWASGIELLREQEEWSTRLVLSDDHISSMSGILLQLFSSCFVDPVLLF